MVQVKSIADQHLSISILVLSALLLSSLPLLAGCESGGTTNQVLLAHSDGSMDSQHRHNSHGTHR